MEIEGLLAQISDVKRHDICGMQFNQGMLEGKSVVLACCGIGKVNAAMYAAAMIVSFPITAIINPGVAGAIARALNIGDIVVANELVHHDMRSEAFGYAPGQVPGLDTLTFKADEALIAHAMDAYADILKSSGHKAYNAPIATGDQFISEKAEREYIWDTFGSYCVEMEGAAIAQVCYINNIPFLSVRCISDNANGAATDDFNEFAKASSLISKKLIARLVKTLTC